MAAGAAAVGRVHGCEVRARGFYQTEAGRHNARPKLFLAGSERTLNPILLLFAYCAVLAILALVGGWLPGLWRWSHIRMQLIMSFIAGFMLAVALIQLLPHAYGIIDDGRTIGLAIMAGLLSMFFLIRIFDYHHHHYPEHGSPATKGSSSGSESLQTPHTCNHHGHEDHGHEDHGHEHQWQGDVPHDVADAHGSAGPIPTPEVVLSCAHQHNHTPEIVALRQGRGNSFAWLGLLMGLGLHSVIEAVALAAALQAGALQGQVLSGSFGIFLAIALHKPLDAMSITSVMTVSHWTPSEKAWVNWSYAISGPLAAIMAFFGFTWLPADTTIALGFALAFSAGTFLCIALGDLLPELHFHSHDRVKLSIALLSGVGLVVLLELMPYVNHAP